ncbi:MULTISPECIES: hypothetical protein [Butyricimonas]|uniref:hypothetical protein n=1 Tax=Butyricimonas TaxID=574697 RepID=UPI0007FB4F48|nr:MULTISPECIES: hypothetical protein [Butyricimonas]
MTLFETPWDFDYKKIFNDRIIEYSDVQEIVQGGPEIGKFSIDNKTFKEKLFGGPCLNHGEFIYLPIYVRKFLNRGFQLCRINLSSRELDILTPFENLIYLDRIEDNKIYYYIDLEKTKLKIYTLPGKS